ncbi:MAG: hypothetical protein HEEMFOPI_00783 [Holosporales bacterium]
MLNKLKQSLMYGISFSMISSIAYASSPIILHGDNCTNGNKIYSEAIDYEIYNRLGGDIMRKGLSALEITPSDSDHVKNLKYWQIL